MDEWGLPLIVQLVNFRSRNELVRNHLSALLLLITQASVTDRGCQTSSWAQMAMSIDMADLWTSQRKV
jgi:hypothetical protein